MNLNAGDALAQASAQQENTLQNFWGDTRLLLISGALLAVAVALALVGHYVLYQVIERLARRKGDRADLSFVKRSKSPARFMLPLLALELSVPFAPLPAHLKAILQHTVGLGMIASVGWGAIVVVQLLGDLVFARYTIDVADNLAARRIRTQTQVLQRTVVVVVTVVTLAIMLMTFPAVRHIGTSLLASAGLAGLIVGMAARSTLTNVIAGMQVALSQPIRIDDAVVVEGEWGWIEEIDASYVVVRIWDLRRLIVPLSYFIEKPFQNWTRTRADLLGTVMIYTDFTAPVDEIRKELLRILQSTDLWDGKSWGLQVTDASPGTMQLRALMSARNGPTAFDLRCYVREKLISFIQANFPNSLPQVRNQNAGVPTPFTALHDTEQLNQ
ncbi:MAG: mechanosensitive ion channel family protein [Candidatus Acidiferrum sp.]